MGDAAVDVFLSYTHADSEAVESVARRLLDAGVTVFLDRWHLVPGEPWQEALEAALEQARTCAVFLGPTKIGAWENEEMRTALNRRVERKLLRVIPVMLPGAPFPQPAALPGFLARLQWVDFRFGLNDEAQFHALVSGVRGLAPGPTPLPTDVSSVRPPYRGLEKFRPEDAEWFFGRESETQQIVEKIRTLRFLAVLGASGSGKSSLVLAGLIPALRAGAIPGGADWLVATLTPTDRPLESLAVALGGIVREQTVTARLSQLEADERALHLMLREAMPDAGRGTRVVLVVDQFEEVFTLCRDTASRKAFIDQLLHAASAEGGQATVILTLRADFLAKCTEHAPLADRVSAFNFLVTPMTRAQLRDAIEKPATHAGFDFEGGLVEAMLDAVEDQPGALPLLQHALYELWKRASGRTLTFSAYTEIGGVTGALAQTADGVYGALPDEQQTLLKRIVLSLVQPGSGTEDTRRRAKMSELVIASADAAPVEKVLRALAHERLITVDRDDDTGDAVLQVAHEALIRKWGRLQSWIDEDRNFLLWRRRLSGDIEEWERLNRSSDALLQKLDLSQAEHWQDQHGPDLTSIESTFIRESLLQRDRETAARERSTRRQWQAAGGVAAVILVLAVVSFLLYLRQSAQANLAFGRFLTAQAETEVSREPDLALLLAVEASRMSPTLDVHSDLIGTVRKMPQIVGFLHSGTATPGWPVLFGQDGRTIVTASIVRAPHGRHVGGGVGLYQSLLLWDTSRPGSASRLATFSGVGDLGVTPDGLHFAAPQARHLMYGETSELNDRFKPSSAIALWPGQPFADLGEDQTRWARSVAFDAQGRQLAMGSQDGAVTIWRVDDKRLVQERMKTADGLPIAAVAFDPAGDRIAAVSTSGSVSILNGRTGTMETAWNASSSGQALNVRSIVFNHDGTQLATGGGDTAVWAMPDHRLVWRSSDRPGSASALAFSEDRRLLVEYDTRGGVVFRNAASGAIAATSDLYVRARESEGRRTSPDGKWVISGLEGDALYVHDKSSPDSESRSLPFVASAATFTHDGENAFIAGQLGDIHRLDLGTMNVDDPSSIGLPQFSLSQLRHAGSSVRELWSQIISDLTVDAEETRLASTNALGTTTLWRIPDVMQDKRFNPVTAASITQKGRGKDVFTSEPVTAFCPDGQMLSVFDVTVDRDPAANRAIVFIDWNAEAAVSKSERVHWASVTAIDVQCSSAGRRVLVQQAKNKALAIYNADTWQMDGQAIEIPNAASGIIRQTSTWGVISLEHAGGIEFWDIRSHPARQIARRAVPPSIGRVGSVDLSRNGQRMAIGNADQSTDDTVYLLDVRSGASVRSPLGGHGHDLTAIAFRPDDALLASGSTDGRVILSSLVEDVRLAAFDHGEPITRLAFSPDGQSIAVADSSGTVIWRLDREYWSEQACRIANRNLTRTEWQRFFSDQPYQKTCPALPEPHLSISSLPVADSTLIEKR